MTTTNFVDQTTVIVADWLNDVDELVYEIFDGATDLGGTSAKILTTTLSLASTTMSFDGAVTIDTSGNNNLTLNAGTSDLIVTASNLTSNADDGGALGISGTGWSDLFLASGGVINFNAGDVTLTHVANQLAIEGGDVLIGTTTKVFQVTGVPIQSPIIM